MTDAIAAKATAELSKNAFTIAINYANDSRISQDSEDFLTATEEERAHMLREDEREYQELIREANIKQDQFRFDDNIARQFTMDIATIQSELVTLRQIPDPIPPPSTKQRRTPSQTSQRSDSQEAIREKEHKILVEAVIKLSKSNTDIDPALIALLGKPAAPTSRPRPSAAIMNEFLLENKLKDPVDLQDAIKMASLGNFEYLVLNHRTGTVEVKIYTPWHTLN
jgi:hypothetical protein